MSTDNVTPIRPIPPATLPIPLEAEEPAPYVTVPGFPHVVAIHDSWDMGSSEPRLTHIEFSGTAEDLVACGAATAEMLAINAPKGPRLKRIDADGDSFHVLRYWRSTNLETGEACAPFRWYRLRRRKPEALARLLPGAPQAIAARVQHDRWQQIRFGERESAYLARQQSSPLRLVVDNTQEAS